MHGRGDALKARLRAEIFGDFIDTVQDQIGEHFGSQWGHPEANFEASVGDESTRLERMFPQHRRPTAGAGAQARPAAQLFGVTKRGKSCAGFCEQGIALIVCGAGIVVIPFGG